MKSTRLITQASSLLFLLAAGACSQKKQDHSTTLVTDARISKTDPAPQGAIPKEPGLVEVAPVATSPQEVNLQGGDNDRITAEVTLAKSKLLGRTFLYGSDLQYSALNDAEYELVLQSLSIGHLPSHFTIVGKTLQLLAEQANSFESDINHPDLLIHEFPIVAETNDTVTISITRGSPLLVTVLAGPAAPKERSSWVRSLKYVPEGDYLMFETSVQGADGSVLEFMESVFPRENIVKSDSKALLADSLWEPLAERFGFLGAGPVYLNLPDAGRVQTQVASRYRLEGDKTIDWYITPNVPDEYLPEIRTGIEGWNRYSQAMWGRDFVRFAGKLPAGVKIGDPRYNVINWDNVAMAGAAYESQASDPTTGIQSHSLIYLPLAWVNIGKEYWNRGEFSEAQQDAASAVGRMLKRRSFAGKTLSVDCLADPSLKISLEARQKPDNFAKELLKGVLFHEMGHALGLAHNFKGSLSFEENSPATFSTSIMDYNQYNLERAAYDSVEAATGPLLEYDRQILSVLYNEGKDVKESDPVLPACDDDVADDVEDGVDPLCIRYDSGSDPSQALVSTMKLLTDPAARLGDTQSLPAALLEASQELGDPAQVATVEEALEKVRQHAVRSLGLVNFYVASGANSLNYMVRANLRMLQVFKDESLPETFKESEVRLRALKGLEFVTHLDALPSATLDALNNTQVSVNGWVSAVPAVKALPDAEKEEVSQAVAAITKLVNGRIYADRVSLLAQVRARVIGSLARVSTAPFHMVNGPEGKVDFEAVTLDMLERLLTSEANGKARPEAERVAYAVSLMSYGDTTAGQRVIKRVTSKLREEMNKAADSRSREEVRNVMRQLKPSAS